MMWQRQTARVELAKKYLILRYSRRGVFKSMRFCVKLDLVLAEPARSRE